MSRRVFQGRFLDAIRKTPPASLAPPDTYDPVDIARILREIGIVLVEVAQPTKIVEERLQRIAARCTSQPVRTVVLPTVLMIQIGETAYEIACSTHSSLQLDAAGRIDRPRRRRW